MCGARLLYFSISCTLATAAQDTTIAAREAYAETREKHFLCNKKCFSPADTETAMTADRPEPADNDLPNDYELPYRTKTAAPSRAFRTQDRAAAFRKWKVIAMGIVLFNHSVDASNQPRLLGASEKSLTALSNSLRSLHPCSSDKNTLRNAHRKSFLSGIPDRFPSKWS